MLNVFGNEVKVLLPNIIFAESKNDEEIREKANIYLKRAFPGRRLLYIEKPFAICERK